MECPIISRLLPTRQRRKEARPAEMIEAALSLFAEKGFTATRLEDVAQRAGVSKAALYWYFDNKEALFRAVIETAVVPLLALGEATLAEFSQDPEALLRALLRGWWDHVGSTRLAGIPKLLLTEGSNFPELAAFHYQTVIVRWHQMVHQALHQGIRLGVFKPVDVETTTPALIAPLMMAALWRQSLPMCFSGIDPNQYVNNTLDLLLAGLRAQPTIDPE